MKSKVIYLQSSFWEQLQSDTSIAGLKCMMNVYEAIVEANLRTDIEDDIWNSDPFLKILWKKYLSSQADIELYENISVEKPEETVEDLTAVYLINDRSKKCDDLNCLYGVVAINSIDMPRKETIFKGDGFLLEKKNIYEDRYLQFKPIINYPCNSMILIDPYLLSNKKKIENNLYYLFEALLPNRKLQVVFQLAIFSMLGDCNADAYKGEGEKYYNDIVDLIKATRKGLNFVLSLYAIGKSEEFHRRMIITNNVFLSADDGFDVFKDNGAASKNATFDIVLPRLVGNNRQDMSNYLRWIKIAKERSLKQCKTQAWGPRNNRLFDLVR